MKIENINSPSQPTVTGAKAEPQISPRERAIAKLMGSNQPQTTPVMDATRVSPEEMSVVQKPSLGQNDSNESVQPSTETVAETKVAEEPLSSQYAVLARKEKAQRVRDQQLKQREAELKAREDALRAPAAPAKPTLDESKYVSREKLLSDPFSVLSGELGLTYDQLTEFAMNAPRPEQLALTNKISELEKRIAALQGDSESTKKTFEEQKNLQRTQAEKQIHSDVLSTVRNNPDFELIASTGSVQDVVDLITKTFDKDGILLSVEEAAKEVEEYLDGEAMKLTRLKKIQQRLQQKPAPVAEKATQPEQQQMKTLTNSVSSTRKLSARERALLAFEGKLTK